MQGQKREREGEEANQGRVDPRDEIDVDILEQVKMIDDSPMELNICENFESKTGIAYDFDPYVWEVLMMEDMCEKESFGDKDYDQIYHDEKSWEKLDEKLVRKGESEEMDRFKRQEVYGYCLREEAMKDREGKFVKVKWARLNKGTSDNLKVQVGGTGVRVRRKA